MFYQRAQKHKNWFRWFTLYFSKKSILYLKENNELVLGCNVLLSEGINIFCNNNATLSIGKETTFNRNSSIFCDNLIKIEENCLFGYYVEIIDSDGHKIFGSSNEQKNSSVFVGEHCWISAHSLILKNTVIGKNSVVAASSLVNKKFSSENILFAGTPVKMIKEDVNWEK